MSPDQYKTHPFVKRLLLSSNSITKGFPHLSVYMIDRPSDFRGLAMFLADSAEFVCGFRTFSDDGTPMVCWSSGDDPIMALINLDKGVGDGRFIVDKKALPVVKLKDPDEIPF